MGIVRIRVTVDKESTINEKIIGGNDFPIQGEDGIWRDFYTNEELIEMSLDDYISRYG